MSSIRSGNLVRVTVIFVPQKINIRIATILLEYFETAISGNHLWLNKCRIIRNSRPRASFFDRRGGTEGLSRKHRRRTLHTFSVCRRQDTTWPPSLSPHPDIVWKYPNRSDRSPGLYIFVFTGMMVMCVVLVFVHRGWTHLLLLCLLPAPLACRRCSLLPWGEWVWCLVVILNC